MRFLRSFKPKKDLSFFIWLFITLYLLFALISITINLIFLSLAFLCLLVQYFQKRQKPAFPGFFWPLVAYAILTLFSSIFSINPEVSLKDSRELLLFLIVPMVYTGFSYEKDLKKANLALMISAYINILYSILYYLFRAAPEERITGFMGHYMTQAGLLCLFCSMALCLFLFSREKSRYLWGTGFILALAPLFLSLTRSAWLGLFVAVTLILALSKPKALIIMPIALGFFLLISPQNIKKRAFDILRLKDVTNIHRIEYLKAGIQITRDYPLFGTGPDMVDKVFQDPKYGLSELAKNNVHLHNNVTQIAAERGIPALLTWLAFMVWSFLSLLKLLKQKDSSLYPFTLAALGALSILASSGLFEYNFADSEITTLFLYMITVPFTLAHLKNTKS